MDIYKNDTKQFAIEGIIWHNDPVTREELYQIVYFESGSGSVQVDFEQFHFEAPCLLFISEYQLFTTLNGSGINGKVIQFSNDFFCIKLNRNEIFCDAVVFNTAHQMPMIQLDEVANKRVEFLIDSITTELVEPSDFQDEIITSLLKTMLLFSSKLKLKNLGSVFPQKPNGLVLDFQNLLEQHYSSKHSVQFYANQLNITNQGLNKATKKELGRTAGELIKEKLVIESKRELYQNKKTIKEITFELGFDDPAYFSRFFKKETQHSPTEFIQTLGVAKSA